MVKAHRHSCVKCQKLWREAAAPQMGALPDFRTSGPLCAFTRVGVDYAGPFLVKQGRGRPKQKRYVAVFTCLQTRACHFEMVSSLDAEGFKMALTRFCARRGTLQLVISDNGSNFVAAEKELREAVKALSGDETVAAEMAIRGIQWKFNPPRAPHFGGIFERVVQSMKKVMQSVLHKADITEKELATAIIQAEGLLNVKPLTVISSEEDDLRPLTPIHFLIGHNDISNAMEVIPEGQVHPSHRWRYLQHLNRATWRRWLKELVPRLNVTSKWQKQQKNVNVGDIMLVMEDNTPRGRWPLGRVVTVFPGRDGVIRVVEVSVRGKVYKRAVRRLIPLDVEPVALDSAEQQSTIAMALESVRLVNYMVLGT